MEKYRDTRLSPEERAQDLLDRLSLEEKMAQVCGVFPMGLIRGTDSVELSRDACRFGIGAVSTLEMRSLGSLEDAADYQIRMQTMIMEQSPHHIPAIFHMEGLCGGYIQDNASLPSGISRGSTWNPLLEQKAAEIVARQERAVGITQILAPVLDVSRDPRMGRQGETYGEDPALAAAMGVAYTKGVQTGERVDGLRAESVAKHFLGFHNSMAGIHGADSMTTPRVQQEIYGKPFQAAIREAGLKGIMPCYCSVDGEATASSQRLLSGLLRDAMGFDGVVISDYGAVEIQHTVHKLYESLAEAGLRSMKAGMDMELPQSSAFNDELKEWFRCGKEDIRVLDEAVRRILTAKFRMGLFEHPFALSGEKLTQEFYREEDDEILRKQTTQSLILLKNNGALPLSPVHKRIAVIGPHATNAALYFGGYTHLCMAEAILAAMTSIAGIGENGQLIPKEVETYPGTHVQVSDTEEFEALLKKIKPRCRNLLEVLRETYPDCEITYAYGYPVAGNDTAHYEEALRMAQTADLCILTLGGKNGSSSICTMGEGVDGSNINLPECQDEFIRQAAKLGKPLIGIHFNGRPISSDAADRYLDAILEAWVPSEMGAEAIVDVLSGKENPSGKLPVSVAYHAGQIPVYYNHPNGSAWHQSVSIGFPDYVDLPHKPRYPFGFGMSYTTFEYANLQLSEREIHADGTVDISFTVKNTGGCDGTEIVQLYLRDCYAGMVRPCMELVGFARVELKKGQEKRVRFSVSPSQMAYLNREMEWEVEAGEIDILVGASSEDIRLTGSFAIADSRTMDGKNRKFYSAGEITEMR